MKALRIFTVCILTAFCSIATSAPRPDLPAPINIVAPGGYDGSHNIHINEDSGFAYLAGVHLQAGAGNNACGVDEPARFNAGLGYGLLSAWSAYQAAQTIEGSPLHPAVEKAAALLQADQAPPDLAHLARRVGQIHSVSGIIGRDKKMVELY